ncbi:ras-related Rab-3C [Pelobates cultripes]|uniref:small monomeric GTPase n=1 Tax=Pelobates cultripes TaxID=61616 RepID=A0AAD1SAN0_PELCU|nr:ras-related Rab-3C [Pelobates cultripes]
MQRELEVVATGSSIGATRHLTSQVGPRPPNQTGSDEASQEQFKSEKLHSLLDATKSLTQAIYSTMGAMLDTLSYSITHALMSTQQTYAHIFPYPPESKLVAARGHKSSKKSHHLDEDASINVQSDREHPVIDNVVAQQQRATHLAKSRELEVVATGSSIGATRHLTSQVGPRPPNQSGSDEASQEQFKSEKLHSLLDATKSLTQAIYSTMGAMLDTLSYSITHALMSTQQTYAHIFPYPPESKLVAARGHKSSKKSHHLDEDASINVQSDREHPVIDNVVAQQQRATHLAKSDTAGQERYRTITTAYYRGAMGFILMYDISNEDSFNAVQDWSTQIKTYSWDNAQVILVGNKCDMEDERVISTERGKHLAEQLGFEFFEASAKDNLNVKQTFERLVDIICDKMSENLETDPTVTTAKQTTRLTDKPPPQQPNCGC